MKATCVECKKVVEKEWLPFYEKRFFCERCLDDAEAERKFLRPINPDPVTALARQLKSEATKGKR